MGGNHKRGNVWLSHNSVYSSTQDQSYLPRPTHFVNHSDRAKWLDTGATAHMIPC
jgi:hypothetical protein